MFTVHSTPKLEESEIIHAVTLKPLRLLVIYNHHSWLIVTKGFLLNLPIHYILIQRNNSKFMIRLSTNLHQGLFYRLVILKRNAFFLLLYFFFLCSTLHLPPESLRCETSFVR